MVIHFKPFLQRSLGQRIMTSMNKKGKIIKRKVAPINLESVYGLLSRVGDDVALLKNDVRGVKDQLAYLKGEISDVKSELAVISRRTKEDTDAYGSDIVGLNRKFRELELRVVELEAVGT